MLIDAEIAQLKKKHFQLQCIAASLSGMRSWFAEHEENMISEIEFVNLDDIIAELKDFQCLLEIALASLPKNSSGL